MEQTINYKGYKIEIVQNSDPEDPRKWDPPSHMYTWHRRYSIGDKHEYSEPLDLLCELAEIERDEEESGIDILTQRIEDRGIIILPIYLYDHSGLVISTGAFSCPWDSGQIGYIYMTKETIEKEGWTREEALKYMEGEVEIYNDWQSGNVYGFRVIDADGVGDSVWGFYGDPEESGCIDEAKSYVDWYIKDRTKKHIQKLKEWIINKVPLQYRKPMAI